LSAYDVDDDVVVPSWIYGPEELAPRYTLYPVAPATEFQLTVMLLLDGCAVAVTFDGAAGTVVA